MSKPKFSYSELALMNWVYQDKGFRFLTKFVAGSSSFDPQYHEIVDRDADGKYIDNVINGSSSTSWSQEKQKVHGDRIISLTRSLGGTLNVNCGNLTKLGYLSYHAPLSSGDERANFAAKFAKLDLLHTALLRSTAKGRTWYAEEGKALYEAAHEKREAKRKSAERMVVLCAEFTMEPELSDELRAMVPDGLKLPLPSRKIIRPIGTATVIAETEKRLTIENVSHFEDWLRYGRGTYRINRWPVQGREPNLYVEPWAIMVDHANDDIAAKLREIDVDDVESFDRTGNHHMKLILPLLIRMHSHLKQNNAAREDIMREAIESFTANPDVKPR